MDTTIHQPPTRPTLLQALHAFHEDQDGLEALQVVMICGIAAVLLLLVAAMIPAVRKWVLDMTRKLIGVHQDDPNSTDLPQ
jgi:hypothetical protein